MQWLDERLVSQHFDPFLPAIDVLETSLVCSVVRKHFSCCVVHAQYGCQLEIHAHFFHDVRQCQNIKRGVRSIVDFRSREMDVEVDQVEVDVVEMSMTMLMYRVST